MNLDNIIYLGELLGAIGAIYIAIRVTKEYFSPIKIAGGIRLVFDGSSPGEILAKVVNNSKSAIYLQSCKAREVKNIKRVLAERKRTELSVANRTPSDIYDIKTYNLLNENPLKMEPGEIVNLRHKLNFNHPLAGFFCSEFVIEVILSNDKTITSKRIKVPNAWLFKVNKN